MYGELHEPPNQVPEEQRRPPPTLLGVLSTVTNVEAANAGTPGGTEIIQNEQQGVQARQKPPREEGHRETSERPDQEDDDEASAPEVVLEEGVAQHQGQEEHGMAEPHERQEVDVQKQAPAAHEDERPASGQQSEVEAEVVDHQAPEEAMEPEDDETAGDTLATVTSFPVPEASPPQAPFDPVQFLTDDEIDEDGSDVPDEENGDDDQGHSAVVFDLSARRIAGGGGDDGNDGGDRGDRRVERDNPDLPPGQRALLDTLEAFTGPPRGRPYSAATEEGLADEAEGLLGNTSLAASEDRPQGPEIGDEAKMAAEVDGHTVNVVAQVLYPAYEFLARRIEQEGGTRGKATLSIGIHAPESMEVASGSEVAGAVEVFATLPVNRQPVEWAIATTPYNTPLPLGTRRMLAELGLDDPSQPELLNGATFTLNGEAEEDRLGRMNEFLRRHFGDALKE